MTLVIELDPDTEAQLTQQAHDKGVDLQTYAGGLLRAATPPPPPDPKPRLTQEGFRAMLDEFAKIGPSELPFDDRNWSRDIIYGDHP